MRANPKDDPDLKRFRAALGEAYGDRLERVVLDGSRARGDHRPDSDYDIAVFVKDPGTLWDEAGRLAEVRTRSFAKAARSSMPCRFRPALTASAPASCRKSATMAAIYEDRDARFPRQSERSETHLPPRQRYSGADGTIDRLSNIRYVVINN
jgi:predicted nucleotidyltransferase